MKKSRERKRVGDDDTIDDEDALPHDLADFDDEDLANDDDDDVVVTVVEAMVPKNPTGEVRKPADSIPAGKPGTSGYRRLQINEACRRSVLSGTIEAHSCLSGDCQGVPDALPFLAQDRGRAKGGTQFDLTPYMQSDLWPKIKKGIEQHLAKIYIDNKSVLKAEHWVPNLDDETYNVEGVRSRRPANISQADWDVHLAFLLDPKNAAWCAQNAQNRAKSTMESSKTREYPSLIQTYYDIHTVDGVFLRDEERLLYEEMRRLQGLGPNTPTGVPYSDGPLFVGGSSEGTFPVLVGLMCRCIGCGASDFHQRSSSNKAAETCGRIDRIDIHARTHPHSSRS
ncbi:hypothetical protein Tco_0537471 [Tanacetum coccineum]